MIVEACVATVDPKHADAIYEWVCPRYLAWWAFAFLPALRELVSRNLKGNAKPGKDDGIEMHESEVTTQHCDRHSLLI